MFVAVLDATTGEEVEGYGVKDAVAMTDVDGLRMVLQWKKKPKWTSVDNWNAVRDGPKTTQPDVAACQAACTGACDQFSFNRDSGHCFTSASTAWTGIASDHITSGCDPVRVPACPAGQSPPGPSQGAFVDSTALAGRSVRLRIHFRDATLYAVGSEG